jgi:hypothetical protein
VACVNACEGLSTEALERLGTLDRARVQMDVIRVEAMQQRDELLAALKVLLNNNESLVGERTALLVVTKAEEQS